MNSKKKRMLPAILIYLCLSFALTGSCVYAASNTTGKPMGYESLFQNIGNVDVYVEISPEDWAAILSDPTAEEYKSVSVTINENTFDNVGFRTKGNSTLTSVANSDSDRYSFRINLNKYVKGQKLDNLDNFVLNNNFSDPSYMREYFSYAAFDAVGATVPLTTYANLYINGELFGYYLMVEKVDDSFLERNFGNDSGNLYKAEMGSTLVYKENGDYSSLELKSGEDTEKTGLTRMIETLNNMTEGEKGNIEDVLDVDSALIYIAGNMVMGNYDSYLGENSHNYFLYELDGIFHVIPWDYNMAFSRSGLGGGRGGSEEGTTAVTVPMDEPVMNVLLENRPLVQKLLSVPEYKEKYYGYIQDFMDYFQNFEDQVNETAGFIRPYVEADPTKFYTMEQFEAAIANTEATTEPLGTMGTPPGSMAINGENGASSQDMAELQPPSGMAPVGMEGRPEGNGPMLGEPPDGFAEMSQNDNIPMDAPTPPDGMEIPADATQGNERGGGRNGMGMMTNGSIVTFIQDRLDNLSQQLSGQLATTGNTTLTQERERGGRPGEGFTPPDRPENTGAE